MGFLTAGQRVVSIATLERTRDHLRTRWGAALVASISAVFALVSMLVGQMLVFGHVPGPYSVMILEPGASAQWWNYPALLAIQPWGVLALPFWATVSMIIVSVGVGLGMSIAVLLGVQLVRFRRTAPKGPAATGLAGALTPAMIALVTLGACCSTTAVALSSIGAAAQLTGTTVNNLLYSSWYLPIVQIAVLWIALVAQEQLVRVYGTVIGLVPPEGTGVDAPTRFVARTPSSVAGVAARVALIFAGVTWGLALLAEWTSPSPPSSTVAMAFQAVFQHLIPAGTAVGVALFPVEFGRAVRRVAQRPVAWAGRLTLGVAGASLVGYTPAVVVGWGVHGFVNGAMGAMGWPSGWGAVAPISSGLVGWALLVVQYLLLGSFCLGLALAPGRTLKLLLWGAGRRFGSRPVVSGASSDRFETPASPGDSLPTSVSPNRPSPESSLAATLGNPRSEGPPFSAEGGRSIHD